jgi:hypothetical protein
MLVATALWMLLIGSLGAPAPAAAEVPLSEPRELTFYAYDYDAKGHIMRRAGVACQALGASGATALGLTDETGHVTVLHSDLFRPGNVAVLFCAPGADLSCSAIRLDVPHLRKFAEYNVRVTQPEIICTDRVRQPGKRQR